MWIFIIFTFLPASILGMKQAININEYAATTSMNNYIKVMAILNTFNNNYLTTIQKREKENIYRQRALELSLISNKYFSDNLKPDKLIIEPDELRKHYLYFLSSVPFQISIQQVYANTYVKYLSLINSISFRVCALFYAKVMNDKNHSYQCTLLEFYLESFYTMLYEQVFKEFGRLTEIENKNLSFYESKRPINFDTEMCANYISSRLSNIATLLLRIEQYVNPLPNLLDQRPIMHYMYQPAIITIDGVRREIHDYIFEELNSLNLSYPTVESIHIGESSSASSSTSPDEVIKNGFFLQYWNSVLHLYSPDIMHAINYFEYSVHGFTTQDVDYSNILSYVPQYEETLAIWKTVPQLLEYTKHESNSGSNVYRILRHIEKTKLLLKTTFSDQIKIGETSNFNLTYETPSSDSSEYVVDVPNYVKIK